MTNTKLKPLHMMYISASQQQASSESDDVKGILEVDREVIHIAINSVSSDVEVTMRSWNPAQIDGQHPESYARLLPRAGHWTRT
jgi:hypothetical protein